MDEPEEDQEGACEDGSKAEEVDGGEAFMDAAAPTASFDDGEDENAAPQDPASREEGPTTVQEQADDQQQKLEEGVDAETTTTAATQAEQQSETHVQQEPEQETTGVESKEDEPNHATESDGSEGAPMEKNAMDPEPLAAANNDDDAPPSSPAPQDSSGDEEPSPPPPPADECNSISNAGDTIEVAQQSSETSAVESSSELATTSDDGKAASSSPDEPEPQGGKANIPKPSPKKSKKLAGLLRRKLEREEKLRKKLSNFEESIASSVTGDYDSVSQVSVENPEPPSEGMGKKGLGTIKSFDEPVPDDLSDCAAQQPEVDDESAASSSMGVGNGDEDEDGDSPSGLREVSPSAAGKAPEDDAVEEGPPPVDAMTMDGPSDVERGCGKHSHHEDDDRHTSLEDTDNTTADDEASAADASEADTIDSTCHSEEDADGLQSQGIPDGSSPRPHFQESGHEKGSDGPGEETLPAMQEQQSGREAKQEPHQAPTQPEPHFPVQPNPQLTSTGVAGNAEAGGSAVSTSQNGMRNGIQTANAKSVVDTTSCYQERWNARASAHTNRDQVSIAGNSRRTQNSVRSRQSKGIYPFRSACSVASSSASWVSWGTAPEAKSFLELLVDRLLEPERAEKTIDILIDMKLYKTEQANACREWSQTRGCLYLVQAMDKSRSRSMEMQCKCCTLMMHLTFRNNANRDAMHHANAAPVIVKAMRKFAREVRMQRAGCGALCNLLSSEHQKFVQARGVDALVVAMKNHPVDQELQERASNCLYNLAMAKDATDCKKLMIAKGAAILLADAQHRFLTKAYNVNKIASRALERLYAP